MGHPKKARDQDHNPTMWHYFVTSLMKNLPTMRKLQKRNLVQFEAGTQDMVRQDGQFSDKLRLYQE